MVVFAEALDFVRLDVVTTVEVNGGELERDV
jgi:hypothetical protein